LRRPLVTSKVRSGSAGTVWVRLGLFCLDCTFSYGQLGDPACELLLSVK